MPGDRALRQAQDRVGVLGGTFDPIHIAHLLIAEEVRTRLELGQVIFVPAGDPYHKAKTPTSHARHRLEMVRLAIEGNPAFQISTVDLERGGPSYSVDTVVDVQKELGPGAELFFLVGWDALATLPSWRDPARLAEMCRLVAMRRPGQRLDWGALEGVISTARERILVLEVPQLDISSTEIRARVAQGRSIRYWVPDAVEAYIREHGLYLRESA